MGYFIGLALIIFRNAQNKFQVREMAEDVGAVEGATQNQVLTH